MLPSRDSLAGTGPNRCTEAELDAWVFQAVEAAKEWQDARDVTGSEWSHCIWHFVRLCRFQPQLEAMGPEAAADYVEGILRRHPDQDPGSAWEIFDDGYSEPSWDAFIELWPKIRQPVEYDDPLVEAARLADNIRQFSQPGQGGSPGRAVYNRFLAIAYHLQTFKLSIEPIALPVERLAEILGVTRQRVGQMRKNAMRAGYLKFVADYRRPGASGGKGLAAKFIFNLRQRPF